MTGNRPIILLAALALLTGSAVGQVTRKYRVVALAGDPAPHAKPGARFGDFPFVGPRIGENGHVAFGSFVRNTDPFDPDNYAIWTGQPGALMPLAVQNDPAPGRPGETLDVFDLSTGAPYWVCPDGSVGFEAHVKVSENASDHGIWIGTPGNLSELAIVNNPAPDLRAATFAEFTSSAEDANGPFLANGNGAVIFRGKVSGVGVTNSNDTAIWIGTAGNLRILAREGAPAGGMADGIIYDDFRFAKLSLNARGQWCFTGELENVPISSNRALFLGDDTGVTTVLREGDAINVPSLAGMSWGHFDKPRLNNDGSVLFENSPKPGGSRSFFVRHADGRVELVAEESASPTGAESMSWEQFFLSKPVLSGSGMVSFNAGLGPGNNFDQDGLWVARSGTTSLVARKGDPAPGFPGQTFQRFQWQTTHRGPAVITSGAVIFRALTSGGADGLWLWKGGKPRLLLAKGEFLDLGAGGVRRVAEFSVKLESGGQSSEPSCVNDRGQLVFQAAFNTGALGTAILLIDNILDLDSDGIDCVLEDAFGGDPDDPTDGRDNLPSIVREGGELILSFPRRTDGSFSYVLESAQTLDDFSDSGLVPERSDDQDNLPPGTERVEVRLPSHGSLFYRVRVQASR